MQVRERIRSIAAEKKKKELEIKDERSADPLTASYPQIRFKAIKEGLYFSSGPNGTGLLSGYNEASRSHQLSSIGRLLLSSLALLSSWVSAS